MSDVGFELIGTAVDTDARNAYEQARREAIEHAVAFSTRIHGEARDIIACRQVELLKILDRWRGEMLPVAKILGEGYCADRTDEARRVAVSIASRQLAGIVTREPANGLVLYPHALLYGLTEGVVVEPLLFAEPAQDPSGTPS